MSTEAQSVCPRRFFLDTEFIESGASFPLILLSIGIVDEAGRELYLVNGDAPLELANDWVKTNVIPFLGEPRIPIREMPAKIREWIGDTKPEFWGYYADYDWVVFCQLFGAMIDLPKGWPMYCRDIKQLCDSAGNPRLPKQTSTEHNALNDARWNKQAWEFLVGHSVPSQSVGAQPGEQVIADLVGRFSAALYEKLKASEEKYGWKNGWLRDDWSEALRSEIRRHVQKGDPRDVAAYCAFAWHHGWSLANAGAQPGEVPLHFERRKATNSEVWSAMSADKFYEQLYEKTDKGFPYDPDAMKFAEAYAEHVNATLPQKLTLARSIIERILAEPYDFTEQRLREIAEDFRRTSPAVQETVTDRENVSKS